MKEFDPDKPFIKVRGMGQIHYEQNGCKFTAGRKYVGKLNADVKKPAPEKEVEKKEDVRARARAKIGKKAGKDSLKDFRVQESPDAIIGAKKEDEAARQAEENA